MDAAAYHIPVLAPASLEGLGVGSKQGGVFVDATFGGGGHTRLMLDALNADGRIYGMDQDSDAHENVPQDQRFTLLPENFRYMRNFLRQEGVRHVDGILADLGVSSHQFDTGSRGFSIRFEGPLDMRMNPGAGETALELIERLDVDELTELISKLGEERRARRVARCIKQAEERGELADTLALRRAIVKAVGPSRVGGVDPATRTFQALRIAVNQELVQLQTLLEAAAQCLVPGGLLAIISFHSLEDRAVKRVFKDRRTWDALTKKPITATEDEIDDNPRSRSAKLRVARYRGDQP